MSWKLPPLETDEAARRILESTDLTDHLDRATMAPLTRQFETKDKALTPRPSKAPLADTCSLRSGDVICPCMGNALSHTGVHQPTMRGLPRDGAQRQALKMLSKWMGHADIKTTAIYAVRPEEQNTHRGCGWSK